MISQLQRQPNPQFDILANYIVSNVAPVFGVTWRENYFCGAVAGSEYETFNAGKAYLAIDLKLSKLNGVETSQETCSLYNMLNAVMFTLVNTHPYWDTTAAGAKYPHYTLVHSYLWFSRIVVANFNYISFSGYKITW